MREYSLPTKVRHEFCWRLIFTSFYPTSPDTDACSDLPTPFRPVTPFTAMPFRSPLHSTGFELLLRFDLRSADQTWFNRCRADLRLSVFADALAAAGTLLAQVRTLVVVSSTMDLSTIIPTVDFDNPRD
jgi:hypothetical protein